MSAQPETAAPRRGSTAGDARPDRPRNRRIRQLSGVDLVVVSVMVAVPTIAVLALVWFPAIATVALSFTNWNGIGPISEIKGVGLTNYINVTTNYPPFWPALQHNLIWLAALFLVATPLGMFFAVLLDKEIRGSRFYQTALYLPVVMSLALIGFVWQLIYSRDQGLLNAVLGVQVDWYGDPKYNLWAAIVASAWRHVGYIMLLYLAGLKAVDGSLREAAAIDGASERQAFFRIIFPVMRPINILVLVITVIEALRTFDLVWVINKGRNGLELIATLVTSNVVGEASRIGFGSAMATIMLLISSVFVAIYLRIVLHVFLAVAALGWLFPVAWALFNSFRDYSYTAENGYVSFGGFTIDNYVNAWQRGDFGIHFWNSLVITVPAVLITLLLASSIAFVLTRFSFKLNIALLGFFLAANLLPPQALLIPVYRMFRAIQLPEWMSDSGTLLNTHLGVIAVNVAFQLGFCTFVLSNYMKTIPSEIYESARVDGASVTRQFLQLTLPLCRPALAALATLQVTWVYNEFFWATVLLQSGDKFPITSSLNNLRGQFFTDYNLLSAGSVLTMLPVLVIFFALQRHFVAGLTLGATKG